MTYRQTQQRSDIEIANEAIFQHHEAVQHFRQIWQQLHQSQFGSHIERMREWQQTPPAKARPDQIQEGNAWRQQHEQTREHFMSATHSIALDQARYQLENRPPRVLDLIEPDDVANDAIEQLTKQLCSDTKPLEFITKEYVDRTVGSAISRALKPSGIPVPDPILATLWEDFERTLQALPADDPLQDAWREIHALLESAQASPDLHKAWRSFIRRVQDRGNSGSIELGWRKLRTELNKLRDSHPALYQMWSSWESAVTQPRAQGEEVGAAWQAFLDALWPYLPGSINIPVTKTGEEDEDQAELIELLQESSQEPEQIAVWVDLIGRFFRTARTDPQVHADRLYAWLRRASGISPGQIAKELNISQPRVAQYNREVQEGLEKLATQDGSDFTEDGSLAFACFSYNQETCIQIQPQAWQLIRAKASELDGTRAFGLLYWLWDVSRDTGRNQRVRLSAKQKRVGRGRFPKEFVEQVIGEDVNCKIELEIQLGAEIDRQIRKLETIVVHWINFKD